MRLVDMPFDHVAIACRHNTRAATAAAGSEAPSSEVSEYPARKWLPHPIRSGRPWPMHAPPPGSEHGVVAPHVAWTKLSGEVGNHFVVHTLRSVYRSYPSIVLPRIPDVWSAHFRRVWSLAATETRRRFWTNKRCFRPFRAGVSQRSRGVAPIGKIIVTGPTQR
jgi:hypothetical protein